jgi:nucleoside-diphosphate-sugar epimerase
MEAYQECYIDSASQLLNSLIKLKQLPKRIIHISSASTLGGTHGEVIDELDAPLPQRQQSLLLRSAEDNIDHFGRSHNIDVCHLKLA